MKIHSLRFALAALSAVLPAQQIISTFAGTEWVYPGGSRPALDAPLSTTLNSAIDPQGRLVIADGLNHVVLRMETSGQLTVIAGNGVAGYSGDGEDALRASLNRPEGIAIDSSGNMFICDFGNRRVRKITPNGIISTIAGTGSSTSSGDFGPALSAGLTPLRITLDAAGGIYINDTGSTRVRKIGTDGRIVTVAGNGNAVFTGPGKQATETGMQPEAIHVDRQGRLLISDAQNFVVVRVGTDGIVSLIAGTGVDGESGDGGPAIRAATSNINALTTDNAGNILLADTSNRLVRRIDANGIINTIAGGGDIDVGTSPVDARQAYFGFPEALAVNPSGRLFIADVENQRMLALSEDGRLINRIAGNGRFKEISPNTPAPLVTLTQPSGLAIASDGTVYFSELLGHRVGKVSPNGTATLVAGNGVPSCCVDNGPAADGRFSYPNGMAFAPDGALIIVDGSSQKIRRIFNGTITSIGGKTFDFGFSGDGGPAVDARFNYPWGVAVDATGNIFIADRNNHRVRKIDTKGIVTTVAGNGQAGFSGDGGQATAASLDTPHNVAITPTGDLLIADLGNSRIRAVSPAGIIRTFAGNGRQDYTGDGGPATAAAMDSPIGLAVDAQGNVFVSHDYGVIRRIAVNGTITTVAGIDEFGFSGDGGSPLRASFDGPYALAVDRSGNLFIADSFNNRIRVIRTVSLTTTLSPSPVNISAVAGSGTAVPVRVNVASSVNGIPFTPSVTYGQSPGNWLTVSASNTNAPATLTLTANASSLPAGRYTATLNVATNPAGSSNPVSILLTVDDAPARLTLSSESFTFTKNEGTASDVAVLEIRNSGGGLLPYQVSASVTGNPQWLKVAAPDGSLRAGQVASVSLTVDPAGLRGGTYLGSVVVVSGSTRRTLPVTLTVRGGRRTILVSQAGLTFTAVAGGGAPTPQKIGILNIGSGTLDWRAAVKKSFTRLSAQSGTVTEPWLAVSELAVSINPAGLSAGQYYDQIEITADADNSPQLVSILLNVLPEGSNPGPEVTPSGMIFISKQGENPGSQTVTFNHLGRSAVTFESSRLGSWYESAPGAGRAIPNGPGSIVVQPALAGLPAGIRRGVVTFQVQEDGTVRTVNLLSVVAPAGTGGKDERGAASCASPSLRVESTALRDGFAVRVGEAVTLEVKASDECGNLLTPLAGGTGAQVVARPENGDPQVTLAHIGNGVWRGTWRPVRAVTNTRMTVVAIFLGTAADVVAGRSQAGKVELSGSVLAQGATAAPLLTAGGVVHAASFESGVPIAPGSLITLYGAHLSDGTGQAQSLPLPASLNGTEVKLGNRTLPLLFTSDGQLNAQVPYDVPVDTQHQISVQRGDSIAVPEMLSVSAAQPGIFTKAQNGSGQGAIVKQDGVTLAQPGTPAVKGEVIVIYCSGLGPVSPPVEAGRPAPSSPLSGVVNPVTVTVGGQSAQVLFAGLAPGFSGLYQINAFVPAGAPSGNAVEVVITAAGQASRPVTIAVQ